MKVPIFLTKSIELYEMICVRHGLMVVGPTGGGKSKNIAVLKEALTHLKVREMRKYCTSPSLYNEIVSPSMYLLDFVTSK